MEKRLTKVLSNFICRLFCTIVLCGIPDAMLTLDPVQPAAVGVAILMSSVAELLVLERVVPEYLKLFTSSIYNQFM